MSSSSTAEPLTPRRARRWPWFLVVIVGAPVLAWLARGVPNLFIEDDAYFYLQIAWNIATGKGSTFDGLHVTNGYHLLWVGVLAPLAYLTAAAGVGKAGFLVAACGLSLAIAISATVATFHTTRERVLALLIFLACGITMETTLLGVVLILAWRVFAGEIRPRPATMLAAALLAPVARIDFAWIVPAWAVIAAAGSDRYAASSRRLLMPVAAGAAFGVGLHLAILRVLFGSWTTVSSALKAARVGPGVLSFLTWNLSNSGNELRYVVLACLIAVVVLQWRAVRDWRAPARLAVVVAPLAGYSLLTSLRDWYFLVALLIALVTASRAGALWPRAWRALTLALSLLMAVAFGVYLARNASDIRATAQFVGAANEHLLPDDIVFGVDGTGFTGWWLHARVINGDGLVNSWEYRDLMLTDRLDTYLRDAGVTHLLTNRATDSNVLQAWHGLKVTRAEAELVAETGPTRNRLTRYSLFRLERPPERE